LDCPKKQSFFVAVNSITVRAVLPSIPSVSVRTHHFVNCCYNTIIRQNSLIT